MLRSDILDEAKMAICGDREKDYGSPFINFNRIADLWSAYLGDRVTPNDVCNMMILLKISRMQTGGVLCDDNFIDIAGYAAIGGEIAAIIERKLQGKKEVPNKPYTIEDDMRSFPYTENRNDEELATALDNFLSNGFGPNGIKANDILKDGILWESDYMGLNKDSDISDISKEKKDE